MGQVHQPRYLPQPARLFGPWYLEIFTRTSWWVVPMIWLPITAFLVFKSLDQQSYVEPVTGELVFGQLSALRTTIGSFLLGNVVLPHDTPSLLYFPCVHGECRHCWRILLLCHLRLLPLRHAPHQDAWAYEESKDLSHGTPLQVI